jgi:dTDP-4-amino-4,6-dideoxygalactose transaminase
MERDGDRLEWSEGATLPWYYEQQRLGFNYRMTDIQAALGRAQLRRLDDFIARRREIARRYDEALADVPHVRPLQATPEWRARSGHHLYVVDIDFDACGVSRAELMRRLKKDGIFTQVHYIPLHHQPYWRRRMEGGGDFPAAERYYAGCLTLPCFPTLGEEDQNRVIDALGRALNLG